MSWDCQRWAAEQPIKPAGRKFVLFMLATWSQRDGTCFAPQERLAKWTGQEERAVRGHLAALEAGAYVGRHNRNSKVTGHRLADGFVLDPTLKKGLDQEIEQLAEMRAEMEIPGRPKRQTLPVGDGEPTGKFRQANRQVLTGQPANFAGCSIEDSNLKDSEMNHAGDPARASDLPLPLDEVSDHEPEKPRRPRRLEADWQPSAKDRKSGRARGFTDAELERHAGAFRDHFTLGPGRNKTWLDWHRAFVNWLNRESPEGRRRGGPGQAAGDRRQYGSLVAAAGRLLNRRKD